MRRAGGDDAGPARLERQREQLARLGLGQLDGLYAHLGLTLEVGGCVLARHVGVLRLEPSDLLVQEVALRRGERVPGLGAEDHAELDVVEARVDAELGLLVPAQVEHAQQRPAVAVDHATVQRGVDLARSDLHHRGAQAREELAVDRRDADLQARQVGLVDALVQVDVVRHAVAGAGVVVQALFHHQLVEEVQCAVAPHLGPGHRGVVQRQTLGRDAGDEGRRGVGQVDDAVAQRCALLHRRHRLRPAQVVDLHDALAFVVDLLDEGLEVAGVVGAFLEAVDGFQRDLLGLGQAGGGQGQDGGHQAGMATGELHGAVSPRGKARGCRWGRGGWGGAQGNVSSAAGRNMPAWRSMPSVRESTSRR